MTWIRFLFSGVCHQIPERSFSFAGQPLPLCARCTGTFLGAFLAFSLLYAMGQGRRTLLPRKRFGILLGTLMTLWALDGTNSFLQLITGRTWIYAPLNSLRLITGMGCGITLGIVLYPFFQYAMWRVVDPRPVIDHVGQVGIIAAVNAGCAALILGWDAAPFALWASLSSLAVLVVFTVLNSVLTILILGKEGLALTISGVTPYLGLGLLASVTEMTLFALLRRLLLGYAGP